MILQKAIGTWLKVRFIQDCHHTLRQMIFGITIKTVLIVFFEVSEVSPSVLSGQGALLHVVAEHHVVFLFLVFLDEVAVCLSVGIIALIMHE